MPISILRISVSAVISSDGTQGGVHDFENVNYQAPHPAQLIQPPPAPQIFYVVWAGPKLGILTREDIDLILPDLHLLPFFAMERFTDWGLALAFYVHKYEVRELRLVPSHERMAHPSNPYQAPASGPTLDPVTQATASCIIPIVLGPVQASTEAYATPIVIATPVSAADSPAVASVIPALSHPSTVITTSADAPAAVSYTPAHSPPVRATTADTPAVIPALPPPVIATAAVIPVLPPPVVANTAIIPALPPPVIATAAVAPAAPNAASIQNLPGLPAESALSPSPAPSSPLDSIDATEPAPALEMPYTSRSAASQRRLAIIEQALCEQYPHTSFPT